MSSHAPPLQLRRYRSPYYAKCFIHNPLVSHLRFIASPVELQYRLGIYCLPDRYADPTSPLLQHLTHTALVICDPKLGACH
jgi:hypothetical protein